MGARKDFLAKLFRSMDTDGSGSLDIGEVKTAMMKMGVHLSSTKFKRLFRLMDATRSGSISYPDFHNLIFPEDEIREKAQGEERAQGAKRPSAANITPLGSTLCSTLCSSLRSSLRSSLCSSLRSSLTPF